MRQQQALGCKLTELGARLTKDRLGPIGASKATFTAGSLHLDTVELDDRAVLSVTDHGGLDNFTEGSFLKKKNVIK